MIKLLFYVFVNCVVIYNATGQHIQIPIFEEDDGYYLSAVIDGPDYFLVKSTYPKTDYSLDVISKLDGVFKISKPISLNSLSRPFYFKRLDDDHIMTAWLSQKSDSFLIVSSKFNIASGQHILVDSIVRKGKYTHAICPDTKLYKGYEYSILSVADGPHLAHTILIFAMNNEGKIELLSSAFRTTNHVSGGIFGFGNIVDFHVLSDTTFLIRGEVSIGFAIIDLDYNILDYNDGRYINPNTNETLFSASLGFGYHIMDSTKIWAFGLYPNDVPDRLDPNLMIYSLDNNTLETDTLIRINNIDGDSKIYGTSASLGSFDAIICLNPDYHVDYKTDIESSLIFKRFRNGKLDWSKTFINSNYLRALDIVALDSCMVMIVGSIYNHDGLGTLQGFVAKFDCNGDIISSNLNSKAMPLPLYPNPTINYINIDLKLIGCPRSHYLLSSMSGLVVDSGILEGNTINVSEIPAGTYILSLICNEQQITRKVIVTN